MGKVVVVILVSLAVGGLVGGFVVQSTANSRHGSELSAQEDLERALDDAQAELKKRANRIATLQEERYTLDNERAELLARLRSGEDGPNEAVTAAPDSSEIDEMIVEAGEQSTTEDEDPRARWRRGGGFNDEERRQRMADWRAEADAMMTDEVSGRLGAAYADHVAALFENRDYQDELRRQIREVETDEEREAIIEEMRAAGRNNQQIMNDIQDGMLRAFVEEQDLGEGKRTGKVVRELRELVESPLFRMEGMFTGGGRRGGGGFGGGRRGGGRP